jgi:hypothetical protein
MSVDGGKSSFSNWDKISEKIMNNGWPDFNKMADFFDKTNKSIIRVMKDEIADDEMNFFIIENRKLRETLKKCKVFLDMINVKYEFPDKWEQYQIIINEISEEVLE